jgi:hypothetical protein
MAGLALMAHFPGIQCRAENQRRLAMRISQALEKLEAHVNSKTKTNRKDTTGPKPGKLSGTEMSLLQLADNGPGKPCGNFKTRSEAFYAILTAAINKRMAVEDIVNLLLDDSYKDGGVAGHITNDGRRRDPEKWLKDQIERERKKREKQIPDMVSLDDPVAHARPNRIGHTWCASDLGVQRAAKYLIYPRILRRACSYALANTGNFAYNSGPDGAQELPTHRAPYRVGVGSVQGFFGHRGISRWTGAWIAKEFERCLTMEANV